MKRWPRQLAVTLGLAAGLVLLAHPAAIAGSDLWGNVAPASPLDGAGLFGRYPLSHYQLDQHFSAITTSLTGGVDASGIGPMIAYFLASILWWLTSFLANLLIELFGFAFSLDLVNGSSATGGAGALAPVSRAIHSIYSNVLGAPWMVLAVSVVGMWAMWRALVQRRYAETAGALGLSLIYVVVALFFVVQPGTTIGTASKWTNQMSEAFLAISDHGDPSGGTQAKDAAADQLFETLVDRPWAVLQFGGLEHCVLSGTGDENSDPESAPVRPLSQSPGREAELARRLGNGTEITADGKVCVNNANKYGSHFLRFGVGTDERDDEYDALDAGDDSKLPDADSERAGYRLGVADKPATDAMEEGGQYQRLLIAIVVFVGELGAFLLLGALSVGVILAQVLLLLLLAFAPVALIAAVIPGRGHDFFKGWLQKLAGYLLRKAAYSLVLAVLLAVNGAIASATSALGWLMSFGLQALFFWFVFLQRRALTDGLVGIATGPGAPGREGTLRVLALYAGARAGGRALRPVRRGARAAASAPGRLVGGALGRERRPKPTTLRPTPEVASESARVGGGRPGMEKQGTSERTPSQTKRSTPSPSTSPGSRAEAESRSSSEATAETSQPAVEGTRPQKAERDTGAKGRQGAKNARRRQGATTAKRRLGRKAPGAASGPESIRRRRTHGGEVAARPEVSKRPTEPPVGEAGSRRASVKASGRAGSRPASRQGESNLGEELHEEREALRRRSAKPEQATEAGRSPRPERKRRRLLRKGSDR